MYVIIVIFLDFMFLKNILKKDGNELVCVNNVYNWLV